MILLWILAAILALWIVFIFLPCIVMFRKIFSRLSPVQITPENVGQTVLAPYADEISEGLEILESTPHEKAYVTAKDGVRLCARVYGNGSNKTVVFLHGYNATPEKNFAAHAKMFRDRGYNLIVADQRSAGESGGAHNGMGLFEKDDVLPWAKKARELFPGSAIVLYGMSMGATGIAFASDTLTADTVDVTVLDCGFSSPYDQLACDCRKRRLPAFMLLPIISVFARVFLKLDLHRSVKDPLSKAVVPAFFLHGEDDRTVDISQGRANFEACASEKQMLTVPGAGHTEALLRGGSEAREKLFAFIDKHINENGRKESNQA